LRAVHAHRRLGFGPDEVAAFFETAGLELVSRRDLAPAPAEGGKLAVSIWLGRDRRLIADPLPLTARAVA
jgi:demethylmenaquinone methyltransferase/2-methoxy-6-polyprenyl-1,4-benzoquinol methylase/ArsR family transcriptional regulator